MRVSAAKMESATPQTAAPQTVAADATATAPRIVEELTRIGFANLCDFIRFDEDGSAYVDPAALTPERAAAIIELTIEEGRAGRGENARPVRRLRVKLHDKLVALEKLCKHLGLPKERGAPGAGHEDALAELE